MVRLALIAILLWPIAAQAQESCADHAMLSNHLRDAYGEAPFVRGVTKEGYLLEVWRKFDRSTFTITQTTPQGVSCIVSVGQDIENILWYLGLQGRDL